jgi:Ca2+:H+ antiporter
LFVIPVLVLLGWAIGQPLDFLFDPFETLLVFLCIASVNWGAFSFSSRPPPPSY